jgi:large subunit ribosomal protein L14e
MMEEGIVCIKTRGKEAGKKVVVLDFDKKTGFATVAGPYVKKRRCNFKHLVPLGKKVQVKKSITQKELGELLKQVK